MHFFFRISLDLKALNLFLKAMCINEFKDQTYDCSGNAQGTGCLSTGTSANLVFTDIV